MVHAQQSADHHGHHIVPFKTLLTIFLALIGLTIFTVLTAQLDLGVLNVPLALAIAITKAVLVVMYFMALKYDRPVNTLVFSIGVIFVLIFLMFTWFDTGFRGDVGNVDRLTIQDRAYLEEQLRERQARIGEGTTAPGGASGTGSAAPTDSIGQPIEGLPDTTAQGGEAADADEPPGASE